MSKSRFENDGVAVYKLNDSQRKSRDIILKKLHKGIYKTKIEDCPYCGGSHFTIISNKDMYGLPMLTVVCTSCVFVYTRQRMTDESLATFYNTDYRQLDLRNPDIELFFKNQIKKGKAIFKFLNSLGLMDEHPSRVVNNLNVENYVIEVGCGAGGILHYFREKGYLIKGCDFGKEYLEYGRRKYDLDLISGGLGVLSPSLTKEQIRPKLIIYEQVLEHISDIKSELNSLIEFVSQETIIYVGVPGIRNLIHPRYDYDLLKYLQIPHLVHFDLFTLTRLMSDHGFELLYGDEVVRAIFKYKGKNLKNSLPKKPKHSIIDYLRKMEIKKILFTPLIIVKKILRKVKGTIISIRYQYF